MALATRRRGAKREERTRYQTLAQGLDMPPEAWQTIEGAVRRPNMVSRRKTPTIRRAAGLRR